MAPPARTGATGSGRDPRRLALADVRNEDAVTKLFNETYKEFANRNGGYTRIYKLGQQRISDAAELALIEFVKADDTGYKKSKGKKAAKASGSSLDWTSRHDDRRAKSERTTAAQAYPRHKRPPPGS